MRRVRHSLTIAASLLAASPAFAQEQDILIDVIAPLTGQSSGTRAYALQLQESAQVFVDITNAHGGLLGRRVRLKFIDDRGLQKEAASAGSIVVGDNPVLVIGNGATDTSIATKEVLKDYSIPYLMLANGNKLTEQSLPQLHRILPRSRDYAGVVASLLRDRADSVPGPIFIIDDGSEYGGGFADALMDALPSLRGRLKKTEVDPGDFDFSGLIGKLKLLKTGIVVLAVSDTTKNGVIIRQADAQGFHPAYMSFSKATFGDFSAAAGPSRANVDIVGVPGCDRAVIRQDESLRDIIAAFDKRGIEMTDGGLGMVTALQVGMQAIRDAGTTDPAKVNAAIRSGHFATATGDVAFDSYGNRLDFPLVLCRWLPDGSRMVQIGGLRYPDGDRPGRGDGAQPGAVSRNPRL